MNLGGDIIDFFELLLTWTWGLGAKGLLLYSHDRPDMLYPSRRCIIWFRTVPDLSTAMQFFSSPPSGVHREKGQQAFGTPPLVILYGRGAIRFLGSALARLLAATTS